MNKFKFQNSIPFSDGKTTNSCPQPRYSHHDVMFPGLLSKTKPLSVEFGFRSKDGEEHDQDGRLITVEFDSFYLLNAYVPNAGRKLVTLDKRMRWDPMFRQDGSRDD